MLSSAFQEWNFIAATVGMKGTEDITAQHFGNIQISCSSNVAYVGKRDTTVEPVENQS